MTEKQYSFLYAARENNLENDPIIKSGLPAIGTDNQACFVKFYPKKSKPVLPNIYPSSWDPYFKN